MNKVTGTIVTALRLRNSTNGNPRFKITVLDANGADFHTLTTKSDAACGFDIENLKKDGNLVTLNLTPAGRVETIDIV